jgi:hypothetical protein
MLVVFLCVFPPVTPARSRRSQLEDHTFSQESLGFETAYHRIRIRQLEPGGKSPSLRTIVNLASALRVKPSEILGKVELSLGGRLFSGQSGTQVADLHLEFMPLLLSDHRLYLTTSEWVRFSKQRLPRHSLHPPECRDNQSTSESEGTDASASAP